MILSLLLQDATANTTSYMIAGFAIIFGVILIYLISLLVRQRNLQRDLEVLQDIQEDEK